MLRIFEEPAVRNNRFVTLVDEGNGTVSLKIVDAEGSFVKSILGVSAEGVMLYRSASGAGINTDEYGKAVIIDEG